jgi:guanylate kinase
LIGIVGVCGSGKSTLINGLKPYNIELRHIAQEHSYVAYMWLRITNPDYLIYLDCSYPETIRRRHLDWTEAEYQEQQRRLSHARQHCHFYLLTDQLTPDQVLDQVRAFLEQQGVL